MVNKSNLNYPRSQKIKSNRETIETIAPIVKKKVAKKKVSLKKRISKVFN